MGIRQQGKQASKPQQKPQTRPGVKHDSLVTCQAASGVIAPNTVDYITPNSTHATSESNRAEHLRRVCFFDGRTPPEQNCIYSRGER